MSDRTCSVNGCDKPHHARGWCHTHYRRWQTYGEPWENTAVRLIDDDEGRFWQKVEKTETCWLWTGAIGSGGYGHFKTGGRTVSVHRWAYEHFVGPVPEDLDLDHLCRIRHCVNFEYHLELVTRQENTLRGAGDQAINARKTHCPEGHPYDEKNTRLRSGRFPGRICKTCESAYKARKKRGGD